MADRQSAFPGSTTLPLDGTAPLGGAAIGDQSADNNLSFEEALRELEEVVTALETGQVPLEQSITLLQRGMALAEICDGTLTRAEATLEQLIATADGELLTEAVAYDDDEEDYEED